MKKGLVLLSVFILAKIVLHYFLVNPIYELHRDEFLYLDQANHPAWGFRSVPPVTSWIAWIIQKLGNSFFWIRFFPALFGALTILLVWKTIESLKGGLYACVLAAVALIFSTYFLRLNMLFHANSLDIFCWTLVFYCLIRFIQNERKIWLYLLAITFAIGFLNKYNIVFCFASLLLALLFSSQRKLLLEKHFYGALVLGCIIISPNLIWQIQHDFPVFRHMKELNDTQLVFVKRLDFLEEQLYFFLGSIFVLIAGFISLFVYNPFKPYQLLFWMYLFAISLFIYLRAKAYYAFGLYPIFFSFGSIYLSMLLQRKKLYYLRVISILVIIALFIQSFTTSLPVFMPEYYVESGKKHIWEDGKKYPITQDFADMLGWKELAHKTDSIFLNRADKKQVLIFCDNYGQAGAINYYSKIGLIANSFNADYLDWANVNKEIKTVIRIKEAGHEDLSIERMLFKKIEYVSKIENRFARERNTQILVLEDPKTDIGKMLNQEIKKIKGK